MYYYKLYKSNQKQKNIRKEMFRKAPFVLLEKGKTENKIFWLKRSSKKFDFQEVVEEKFFGEIPKEAKKITKKYFESLIY